MSASRRRPAARLPACRGPCFVVHRDGGAAPLRCLADDLGLARRGRALRWASAATGVVASKLPPAACRLGVAIAAHGLRIAVRATDHAELARLCARLPPGWRAAGPLSVDRAYSLAAPSARALRTLYADTARLSRSRRLDTVLNAFESDLHHYVAEWAPRRVFIHAGVVGWRGRAIVLPGRSMSGKTSLVAELIRAGAAYYSDEYAVLDASGRVHPFARALGVRAADGRRERLEPAAVGARVGHRGLPVGLIVVSRYRAGSRWEPRVLSAGAGALALLANAVAVRQAPERVLSAIHAVVERARILRGVRGEAAETARAILDHLRAAAPDGSSGRPARQPTDGGRR